MKKTILILTLLVLFTSTSMAFDGNRKGFVLGVGLEYALSAGWKLDESMDSYETGDGVGIKFNIGYGIDERNTITFEGNSSGFYSERQQRTITQGFNGASWHHYLKPNGKTFFTNLGIGFYSFYVEDYNSNESNIGGQIGFGYEFAHHWQAGLYFSIGKTTNRNLNFKHNQINFTIDGIAF